MLRTHIKMYKWTNMKYGEKGDHPLSVPVLHLKLPKNLPQQLKTANALKNLLQQDIWTLIVCQDSI